MAKNDDLAEALARIAEERECRTGELDLSRLDIDAIPPEIAGLTWLKCLTLDYSRGVSDLSPLSGLASLQQVYCSDTQVSDLSPLAGLASLQQVGCSHTPVSDLWALSGLASLQYVGCSSTQVSDLSPLSGLASLQQVECSSTQVSDLSPLSGLASLQRVYCSFTPVSDLSPLSGLASLQQVDCGYTPVSDLSPLCGLPLLKSLDCTSCRLNESPAAFFHKPSLEELIAFETYMEGLPPELLSRRHEENCLQRIRSHFADAAFGVSETPDVKLMLLGNGGVGKTNIARWLTGETYDPEWDSTHGIHIFSRGRDGSLASSLHLKIWDFGGQDIYHSTHAMFLRGAAILMPVWAKDRENADIYELNLLTFRNHPLAYWASLVTHQGSPQNPVLIVQSKCDTKAQEELRFPIPEDIFAALKQAKPYVEELRVSPQENRGRGKLEDALQDAVTWMRHPDRLGVPQIGAGRLRVQRRLEALRDADMARPPDQRQHRLLEQTEFEAICDEEGGVTSPAMLLDYLDANGTVLYRPGLFEGRIILDQGWALDAIYAVFDRKRAYGVLLQDQGRFSRAKLGFLVWQNHTEADQALLLSMMVSCGICFLHRRFNANDHATHEYIAPDLLPLRETVQEALRVRWDDDRPSEMACFRYGFLHGGLIRAIISHIGQIAGVDALYWRGGLFAYEAQTRSRILIEEEKGEDWQGAIRVRTQGGQAATLLQKAIDLFAKIQSQLGVHSAPAERSSPQVEMPKDAKIVTTQEKPALPEWYVSYAWGDTSREGILREEIVDRLCDAAKARGLEILRDKNVLGLGDSISAFMRRIGTGDRVFVILSEKYLRSPHCMFELNEIWRTSRQEGAAFRQRIRIFALPETTIFDPKDWANWAIHWKEEHDKLENLARQHGTFVLGDSGSRRLSQMRTFYNQVADILGTLADTVQPRTFEQLESHGFEDAAVQPQ